MNPIKNSLLVLIALATTGSVLIAQSQSPAKTKTPSPASKPSPTAAVIGDPFDKARGTSAQAANTAPDNVCFTVEVYTLSQDDAAKLLDDNPGGEARHDAVLKLAGEGKAWFEKLLSVVTKSGQRTVVEMADEFRYPTEFEFSSVKGEPAMPTVFEMRNLGYVLECEPVLSPDKSTCDMNMNLSSTHFLEFKEFRGRAQDKPVAQPQFETRKLTSSMYLIVGKNQFLGTLGAAAPSVDAGAASSKPQEVRLVFGRITTIAVVPDASAQLADGVTMEHQLMLYSMDRESARQILVGDLKPDAYYDAVHALQNKQQARLEYIIAVATKSGQRAVAEQVNEARYPTEFAFNNSNPDVAAKPGKTTPTPSPSPSPTPDPRKPAAWSSYGPTTFEVRNVGLTLEIEPVAGKSIVDLNLAPQTVLYLGDTPADGMAALYPAQPLFEVQKVTTSFSAHLKENAYIGTFSPPGDTGVKGRKEIDRAWLGFIRTVYSEP